MAVELSASFIKTLKRELKTKLPDREQEYRDTKVRGLVLRVRKTGMMSFCLVYGRGKRYTIGSDVLDVDQARERARKFLAELELTGIDPITAQKEAEAAEKLAAEVAAAEKSKIESAAQLQAEKEVKENYLNFLDSTYRPYLASHLRGGVNNSDNVRETYNNLKNRFTELHSLRLCDITSLMIEQWKQRRLEIEGVSPSTINRQLNDLRACLNKAKDWGLLETNPCDKVDSCEGDTNSIVRYLTPEEEARLRQALDIREAKLRASRVSGNAWRADRGYELQPEITAKEFADHLKPAVILSLNTGLRRGELLKLKWSSIDFERKNLTVEASTAKAGKTRHIRMNNEAIEVLKVWKSQSKVLPVKSLYVFCDDDGQPFTDMRTSWEGLLKLADIKDFRWHDLRHTFASKLVIAGVDLNKVRALLGHSDYKMTLRYAHLAPDHMQDAVDKLLAVN